MCSKRSLGTGIVVLLLITLSLCLLSCGDVDLDLDQEQTEEPLTFIEFVLFPTAPYVDKSYIEKVPEDEVAVKHIDFEADKQAIREVYGAFIKAFVEEDMTALRETLDIAHGIEFGTTTGIVYGWYNVQVYLQARWLEELVVDCQSDPNWKLTDLYIRPKNISAFWTEASVRGPTFYYTPDVPARCYSALGRFYLTKKSGEWRIHQIDGSKYFADETYRVR